MSATTIESAVCLLIHARNSHGSMRSVIREAIRKDLMLLRAAKKE